MIFKALFDFRNFIIIDDFTPPPVRYVFLVPVSRVKVGSSDVHIFKNGAGRVSRLRERETLMNIIHSLCF